MAKLKKMLKERDYETKGNKNFLQQRLRDALEQDGENPDSRFIEIDSDNMGSPFERIAIGVAGSFAETELGSNVNGLYALLNQEASTIADALVKDWICWFDAPSELHAD